MEQILIFAGTKEGRLLAEHLTRQGIDVHISVATAYGKEVLQQREGLVIHQGRLSQPEMEALLKEQEWEAVVDATHPYAREVSKNLREACKTTGKMYLRLLREPSGEEESWGGSSGKAKKEELRDYYYVDTKEEAAAFLNETEGNILLTTGSKELRDYIRLLDDPSRIYARILPDGGMVNQCRSWGLSGSQIICMQGPFSAELNAAMLKQVNAKYLVTKDTGDAGGFLPKLAGARAAKAKAVVIRRPGETEGFFMNQLLEYLKLPPMEQKGGSSKESHASPRIFLLGIGMGSVSGMTGEAVKACECADVILGAGRMLETLSCFGKPMEDMYDPYEILGFIKRHPEYQNIVAAFSGDIGFYSGTKRLLELLETEAYQVEVICGISSAAYAAAKLHMPWQDMKLVSIHGRPQNLIGAVRAHEKVFALAGKRESVREAAKSLIEYGFSHVTMHVASQLSYPEEEMITGTPETFLSYDKKGLSVLVLENPMAAETAVTHGLKDEVFQRGGAPMTKEEVRSVSLSKLMLTKDALVYDIGAGTGSIGIECALQASRGTVYAVEKKEEAVTLLTENARRLGAANLVVVKGTAPEALKELPAPTHVFVGGSSGNLEEIVGLLLKKNPKVRIVVNAISLETVAEAMRILETHGFQESEIVQVSVAKSRTLGGYHMMTGQNPVYIFTMSNQDRGKGLS